MRLAAMLLLLEGWTVVEGSSHPPCSDPSCTKEPADSKVFQVGGRLALLRRQPWRRTATAGGGGISGSGSGGGGGGE